MVLTSNPDITCPDQLPRERGFAQECALCGEMSAQIDAERGTCDNCTGYAKCARCGGKEYEEDVHSGICLDCLRIAAQDENTALEYLKSNYVKNGTAIDDVAERIAEILDGGAVMKREMRHSLATRVILGAEWAMKTFNVEWCFPHLIGTKYSEMKHAAKDALKEHCEEDLSHFAEWLATGTNKHVRFFRNAELNTLFGNIEESLAQVTIRKGVAV